MLVGDRLLAHDDERGRVVEIDFPAGSIVKDFELGGPRGRVADDFEGIAAAEGRLYLVTSSGRLYEFAEGADGETVPYNRHTRPASDGSMKSKGSHMTRTVARCCSSARTPETPDSRNRS